jgi:hypothetical protein
MKYWTAQRKFNALESYLALPKERREQFLKHHALSLEEIDDIAYAYALHGLDGLRIDAQKTRTGSSEAGR